MKRFSIEKKFAEKLFVCLALVFLTFAVSAQTTERDRIAPKSTPTPRQTPTPKISPTPTQTPSPKPSPSISPAPTATPTPRPQQTVFDLQASIRRVLQNPALSRGQVGVKIVSLDTGKTLFEENAEKYFMPASNMKSFTVAAALDRLSPNFRFVTSVYAPAKPDADGTIRGDVVIYGRGDPLISTASIDGVPLSGLNALADKIAASGVKRIEGSLIGDESYFSGAPVQVSWEWDDLQWKSGAEVSALSINDNLVQVQIAPASQIGMPCVVTISPQNQLFTVINSTRTAAAGAKQELEVHKRLGTNILEIRGAMPLGGKAWSNDITIAKPAEMFAALLKNALVQKGVVVTGQTRTIDANFRRNAPLDFAILTELARYESPAYGLVAAKTMKPSQNTYTELTLRALGETAGDKTIPNRTSAERGAEVVQKFLTEAGIAPASVVIWDGSGLSRHNLITPNAAVQLYSFMSRHRFAQTWRESLTIGGVDGTLQNRFKNTIAAGNVRGKTGTIDQVGTLSGYVTTASGEKLAFSILTNALPESAVRRSTMDEIVLLLANFNGKSQ